MHKMAIAYQIILITLTYIISIDLHIPFGIYSVCGGFKSHSTVILMGKFDLFLFCILSRGLPSRNNQFHISDKSFIQYLWSLKGFRLSVCEILWKNPCLEMLG